MHGQIHQNNAVWLIGAVERFIKKNARKNKNWSPPPITQKNTWVASLGLKNPSPHSNVCHACIIKSFRLLIHMIVDSFRFIRNTNTLRPKTCFFRTFGARTQTLFNAFIHFIRLTGMRVCHNRLVVFYFRQSPPKTSKLFLEGRPKPTTSCPRWYEKINGTIVVWRVQVYCKRFGFVPNSGFHSYQRPWNHWASFCQRLRFGRCVFEYCFCQIQENRKLFGIYYQYDLHIILCVTLQHSNTITSSTSTSTSKSTSTSTSSSSSSSSSSSPNLIHCITTNHHKNRKHQRSTVNNITKTSTELQRNQNRKLQHDLYQV